MIADESFVGGDKLYWLSNEFMIEEIKIIQQY